MPRASPMSRLLQALPRHAPVNTERQSRIFARRKGRWKAFRHRSVSPEAVQHVELAQGAPQLPDQAVPEHLGHGPAASLPSGSGASAGAAGAQLPEMLPAPEGSALGGIHGRAGGTAPAVLLGEEHSGGRVVAAAAADAGVGMRPRQCSSQCSSGGEHRPRPVRRVLQGAGAGREQAGEAARSIPSRATRSKRSARQAERVGLQVSEG